MELSTVVTTLFALSKLYRNIVKTVHNFTVILVFPTLVYRKVIVPFTFDCRSDLSYSVYKYFAQAIDSYRRAQGNKIQQSYVRVYI